MAMVAAFRDAAERRRFLIVAPDSRISPNGDATWEVGDHAGEVTEDLSHIRRCVDELRAMPGVLVDSSRVLVAGFSGGGSTAPYLATNDDAYTAFAILHGGVFVGGLGSRRVRAWVSTGEQDVLRPPAGVSKVAADLRGDGFTDVTLRTFSGGHELGSSEVRTLLGWWLE